MTSSSDCCGQGTYIEYPAEGVNFQEKNAGLIGRRGHLRETSVAAD